MKILTITDIHAKPNSYYGLMEVLEREKPDLLLVAGDITNFGPSSFASEFFGYISSYFSGHGSEKYSPGDSGSGAELGGRVIAVRGNCDTPDVKAVLEEMNIDGELRLNEVKTCGNSEQREQIVVLGIGGSPETPFGTPYEYDEEMLRPELEVLFKKAAARCKEKGSDLIVLSHAPAQGINDEVRGAPRGSSMLKQMCELYPPAVFVSGHIHEARGVVREGSTLYINPGPFKEGYYGIIEKSVAKYKGGAYQALLRAI
ncbi:MAG: metallophosphoesterase [Thermoplasmata archaeon]